MQKHRIKSSSNMFWILVRIASESGNSNKYPKHMFYEEIRIKQGLPYISFCPLKILYNSKFIIMATSLGTNAVVVTKVHCISLIFFTDIFHFFLKPHFPYLLQNKQALNTTLHHSDQELSKEYFDFYFSYISNKTCCGYSLKLPQ